MVEYARLWNQRIRDARHGNWRSSRPYCRLTYENLLTSTEAQLTDVPRAQGVPVEAPSVAAARCASGSNLSGGRTRGDEDAASHYRRGQAGGWRDDLGERERSGVLNMAGG